MSGNSLDDAICFSDDETATFSEDELDVQNYSKFGACAMAIPLLTSASRFRGFR
jgi:hypothetical protein